MKKMLCRLFVFLFSFLLSCQAPDNHAKETTIHYFPDQIFAGKRTRDNSFYTRYYSKFLNGFGEPSLYEDTSKHESYRFLYVPSWDYAISVRITKINNNSFELDCKQGTLSKSKIDSNKDSMILKLSIKSTLRCAELKSYWDTTKIYQWDTVEQKLANASFWNLPTTSDSVDAVDGTMYVLEGIKNENYHVVHRLSPEKIKYFKGDQFREICLHFLKLASVNFDYVRDTE